MPRFFAVLPLLTWALAAAALGVTGAPHAAPLCAVLAGLGLHLHHRAVLRRERERRPVPVPRD